MQSHPRGKANLSPADTVTQAVAQGGGIMGRGSGGAVAKRETTNDLTLRYGISRSRSVTVERNCSGVSCSRTSGGVCARLSTRCNARISPINSP